jgi:membrane protein DedA with SNARE-associated domain
MSEMEPEVRRFLQKVVWTLTGALLWLTVNMYIGVYKELAFPVSKITVWNILFYVFALVTLVLLIIYYFRLWKNEDL